MYIALYLISWLAIGFLTAPLSMRRTVAVYSAIALLCLSVHLHSVSI